jgi:hypothetical protein
MKRSLLGILLILGHINFTTEFASADCNGGSTELIGIVRDIYVPFNQTASKTVTYRYLTDPKATGSRSGTCAVAFYTSWQGGILADGIDIHMRAVNISSITSPSNYVPHTFTLTVPAGFPQQQITVQVLQAQSDVNPLPSNRRIGSFFIFIGSEALTKYAWRHAATAWNISGNSTRIADADQDGNGLLYVRQNHGARILVTPVTTPGGVVNNHPIGVWYDGTDWNIFNEDDAAMPVGAEFNVRPEGNDFSGYQGWPALHRSTTANTFWNDTVATENNLPGNPEALVQITHNWNPPDFNSFTKLPSPLGVWFTGHDWSMFTQNFSAMPIDIGFNTQSLGYAGEGAFVHIATAANTSGAITTLNNDDTNENSEAMLFVTPNWNPNGAKGVYFNDNFSVEWNADASRWSIRSLSGTTIPVGTSFNVYVPKSPI